MTLKVTERDKKLLVFLAAFLLIFGIGFLVIDPLATSNVDLQFELETARMEKTQNIQKINMETAMEERKEEEQEQLEQEQQEFFSEMTGSGVDQTVTEMALKNGTEINELDISMPELGEYAELGAYMGSEDETKTFPGVYDAQVRMTLTGSHAALQAVLDECAGAAPKIHVEKFTWQTQGNGEMMADAEEKLDLALSVYMYQDAWEYFEMQQAAQGNTAPEGGGDSAESADAVLDMQ